MKIGTYPITVIADIARRNLKRRLKLIGYRDDGIGRIYLGADQMWKYLNYNDRPTAVADQMQVHVRMWRRKPMEHSFRELLWLFLDDLFDNLTYYLPFFKSIYKLNLFPHSNKTLCSPHYEPGWASPEHLEMLEKNIGADYKKGTEIFTMDLDRLKVNYNRML